MAVTIELIKQLRAETGAGVLECREALEQAGEEYGKARGILRQKGLEAVAKKADRPVSQGIVEVYSHGNGRVGVMVEVHTETDYASRSAAFRLFTHEVALQVAASTPRFVREEDIPAEVIESEAQKAAERARDEGKDEAILGRVVAGRLEKFKDEQVLLRQAYIRDETINVQQLLNQAIAGVGENIVIQRFARWELGDGEAVEDGLPGSRGVESGRETGS